jgi:hypothetical protein
MRDRLNRLLPPAPKAAMGMPTQGQPQQMPTINIVTPSTSPEKDKKLTEGEKARIRAACSLPRAQFEEELPPFYSDWMKDGKTKEAARTWLTHHIQSNGPTMRLHPSTIYVSDDMVNDIKALNFRRGGELTYADCHRGLSPFMCPSVGAKKRKEMDKKQERHAQATLVTPDDVRLSETGPGELPSGVYGVLQQLSRYSSILEVLAGPHCYHKQEVDAILTGLMDNSDQFEELSQRQILYILWDVHRDARRFFSRFAPMAEGDEALPRSSLSVMSRMIQGGAILTSTVGVPEVEFLGGQNPTKDILTSPGGGTARELFPDATKGGTGPHINSNIAPEFKAALAPIMQSHPKINIQGLCRQVESIGLKELAVGRRGHHCTNFNVLGICADKKCRYQHSAAAPQQETISKVAAHLQQIVASIQKDGLKAR